MSEERSAHVSEWLARPDVKAAIRRNHGLLKRRVMTGFWSSLTAEQQATALAYRGPENNGPDGTGAGE